MKRHYTAADHAAWQEEMREESRMVRLCADAMGIKPPESGVRSVNYEYALSHMGFNPLKYAEQAFFMVNKFELHIHPPVPGGSREWWVHTNEHHEGREAPKYGGSSKDLNRAIVECVAKMQKGSSQTGDGRE